jgi:ribosomal protein S14
MREPAAVEQQHELNTCRYCGRRTVYSFRICRVCQDGAYFAVVPGTDNFEVVAVVESGVTRADEGRVHISWAPDRTAAEAIADDLYRAI